MTVESQQRGDSLRIVVDETRPVIRPIQITGLERRLTLQAGEDAAAFQA